MARLQQLQLRVLGGQRLLRLCDQSLQLLQLALERCDNFDFGRIHS